MKKFISFSGGVESRTMCLLYGKDADAIFSDTAYEHTPLYDGIKKVEKYIQDNIRPSFKVHMVGNVKYTLPEYIKFSKYYPSFKMRYCTRMFKIEPIDEYLEQYKDDGVEIMIGLNVDEIELRTGNHGLLPFVKYSYPLADDGITRQMCEDILNASGLHPEFPVYMSRGGCIGCFYKSKKEYEAMVHLAPDEFDLVADIECEIQDKRDRFYHIKTDIPQGLRQFKVDVLEYRLPFTTEEMYQDIDIGSTPCGVFCHR